ncbi:hypothetical protein GGF46_000415 [Coemansia sp. RSA 552]|nr:hypothetical protein GGF46_000415 [Coemansia sp. RSA 552]
MRPQQKASSAIPVHDNPWGIIPGAASLDRDEADEAAPSASRVLRIGAPAHPPRPRPPPRKQHVPPPPLTKRQRQHKERAERQREERANAAALQEQRLRSHQKEQFDMRAHEQWDQERRRAAQGSPKGAAPNRAKNAPALVDGQLIWD